jgi:hypothetical protein
MKSGWGRGGLNLSELREVEPRGPHSQIFGGFSPQHFFALDRP